MISRLIKECPSPWAIRSNCSSLLYLNKPCQKPLPFIGMRILNVYGNLYISMRYGNDVFPHQKEGTA